MDPKQAFRFDAVFILAISLAIARKLRPHDPETLQSEIYTVFYAGKDRDFDEEKGTIEQFLYGIGTRCAKHLARMDLRFSGDSHFDLAYECAYNQPDFSIFDEEVIGNIRFALSGFTREDFFFAFADNADIRRAFPGNSNTLRSRKSRTRIKMSEKLKSQGLSMEDLESEKVRQFVLAMVF